jgi:hypothetical protein
MEQLVELLMERESIEREEFLAVMNGEVPRPRGEESTPSSPGGTTVVTEPEATRPAPKPRFRPEPGPA